MKQLENHMVIGDYYRDLSEEPDTCAICGDEEYDMPDTWRGTLCSSCTRPCVLCGDWLLNEETTKDSQGNEAHKACAEDYEANKAVFV